MEIEEILKRNREFVQAGGFDEPRAAPDGPLLVLAPASPRLAGGLETALGLEAGQAVLLQWPGAWAGSEERGLVRAVALAVHLHGCREILVVGLQADPLCPPAREAVREAVHHSGLQPGSPEADSLRELLTGPSSPTHGVLDTVRLLSASAAVPTEVRVHAALLSATTGALELVQQGRTGEAARQQRSGASARREADPDKGRPGRRTQVEVDEPARRPRRTHWEPPPFAPTAGDVVMPDMPDIALPDIPPLDLSVLDAPAGPQPVKPTRKASDYGRGEGSGPMPMSALQKPADLAPAPKAVVLSGPSIQGIQIHVPETAPITGTGLGDPNRFLVGAPLETNVQATPPGRSAPAAGQRPAEKAAQPQGKAPPPKKKAPQPQGMPPQGERVLDLGPAGPHKAGLQVDLQRGVLFDGTHQMPLDPELRPALMKVADFLARELEPGERVQILVDLEHAARAGEASSELLKRLISPVLKMGNKRYAVINELLQLKEFLPRLSPAAVAAILEALVKSR
jgi:hypothetical protein